MTSAGLRQIPDDLDGAGTDPAALGIMRGLPAPPDKQVRFDDLSFMSYPNLRWSLNHRRELSPSAEVWRGSGAARPLANRLDAAVGEVSVQGLDGRILSVDEALVAAFADAFVVLHDGELVFERYFGEGAEHRSHMAFSITKSVTALLALQLVAEERLSVDATVGYYVPGLRSSGYGDATIGHLLDMSAAVRFVEDYADYGSEVARYGAATHLVPSTFTGADPAVGIHGFLTTLRKEGSHGSSFHYVSPTADVLAWVIAELTGQTLAERFSETIWSRIGAEHDAYVNLDRNGVPIAGTGLCTTARDLARFGQLMCDGGSVGDERVVDPKVVDIIAKKGSPSDRQRFVESVQRTGSHQLLRGWSYGDMWWHTNDADGAYCARGIYGQNLYVNSRARVVIARYSSSPVASNDAEDTIMVPMVDAIVSHLDAHSG